MRWLLLLFPLLASSLALGASVESKSASPKFEVECRPIIGGAELLTVFSNVPGDPDPVPLVSVLRDTLGDADPSNDRLRYIWTLTSASPSLVQRATAAIPFFYWRTGIKPNPNKKPEPVMDMGDTTSTVWNNFAQQIVQWTAMDPNGMWLRASTRRYRTNVADQRRVHLMEALAVLSQLEHPSTASGSFTHDSHAPFTDPEMFEIQARMELAGQTLGGLVTEAKLPEAYLTQRVQREETRGHNWELLRQRAERNGLYFEPIGIGDEPTHAILWIARQDAAISRSFDSKFLGIGNPYNDPRIRNWKGVRVTRYFDASGREVDAATPGAKARELIPLALYGLNYPKVPLRLIDFRDTTAPKRREMIAGIATDAIMGMVGYSKFGNWPYLVGSMAWNFAATRRGAATNRQLRLKAFAEVRRWLALDQSLSPELRVDLQKRLESVGINPLGDNVFNQTKTARKQYAALLADAANPTGLAARLERDRASELSDYEHGTAALAGLQLARVATLGLFKYRDPRRGSELTAALDAHRRGRELSAPEKITPLEVARVEPKTENTSVTSTHGAGLE